MAQNGRIVGIDVSKRKVDACVRGPVAHLTVPCTPDGEAALITWLQEHQVEQAVLEASGGYERPWAAALRRAGIVVRIVDPKRVRYFARSAGRLAKNDVIDAEMIARFAETFADDPAPASAPDAAREEIDQLMTARALLLKQMGQTRQMGEHQQPAVVRKAQAAIEKAIQAQLAKLDAEIEAKIAAQEALAARKALIESVPGFGRIFAAGVIAWLPELGRISNKAAAALVGVAPYDDDSGARQGERHISGGRREIRDLLYMAVLGAATQHNPVIKAYYQRLRAKGKKTKVALVACMRKLLVILNVMLRRGEPWNPTTTGLLAAPSEPAPAP